MLFIPLIILIILFVLCFSNKPYISDFILWLTGDSLICQWLFSQFIQLNIHRIHIKNPLLDKKLNHKILYQGSRKGITRLSHKLFCLIKRQFQGQHHSHGGRFGGLVINIVFDFGKCSLPIPAFL